MDSLIHADQSLFLYLNGLHSSFWDPVMVFISGKFTWLPVYLLLLWLIIRKRKKQFWFTLIAIALLVLACDQISVLIKFWALRPRPCHDTLIGHLVHLVNGCGGQYGFISSHAANTFGVAMFLTLLIRNRWFGILIMLWAFIVSYSRIYLGVHYPGDILGGIILGLVLGVCFSYLEQFSFRKFFIRK